MSKPTVLSYTQIDTILRLAGPLSPPNRAVYLREVAAALDGREDIGDGFVARMCAEVERRLWHPPLEDAADMSAWRSLLRRCDLGLGTGGQPCA